MSLVQTKALYALAWSKTTNKLPIIIHALQNNLLDCLPLEAKAMLDSAVGEPDQIISQSAEASTNINVGDPGQVAPQSVPTPNTVGEPGQVAPQNVPGESPDVGESQPDQEAISDESLTGDDDQVPDQPGAPSTGLSVGQNVSKAFNPVAQFSRIQKSWKNTDGTTTIEGWISTDSQDQQKDIVPPECFTGAIDGYMSRSAPLSSEHNMKALPIGHMQHIALVRDGTVFKSSQHPHDFADFEHFPQKGTGVYGRGVITDEVAGTAVRKGNIGGFSWIGNLTEYEALPNGGRKFRTVNPWVECTISAYPVNQTAVITIAKSFQKKDSPTVNIEEILAGAAQAAKTPDTVSKSELKTILTDFAAQIAAQLDSRIEKAMPQRGEGIGRRDVVTLSAMDQLEADPAAYIVKKSLAGEELTAMEREIAWQMTLATLTEGMNS